MKVPVEGKLGASWEGLYKVVEVGGKKTYNMDHMNGNLITKR